jgi:hypothetical protein
MAATDQHEPGREVLIVLERGGTKSIDRITEAISNIGGRVLMGVSSVALVALLSDDGVKAARGMPNVRGVEVGAIDPARIDAAPRSARAAMSIWNSHLARKQAREAPAGSGISWGAAGREPPDAPAKVREMLRRRERELKSGGEQPAKKE